MDSVLDYVFPAFFWLVGLLAALLVLWGIAWCVCEVGARRWEGTAVVVGKAYQEDTQETNPVPVATGNGVGIGVVTTGHPRAWITLLKHDGTVYEFNNVTVYVEAKVGDRLRVKMKHNAVGGTTITEVWPKP